MAATEVSTTRRSMMSQPTISRGFVDCDGRAVHYRCAGEGPAVILLHDSPRSSRLHLPTIAHLAPHFRVFAFDTPGYGNSDPLPMPDPTIPDFAAALGEAIERLGLQNAPIYAAHTGSKIALEYAATRGHAAGLVLDGLAIPTAPPNPAFIDAYMRPYAPDGYGAYLATEWTRMRDMARWFPWFDRRPETRMTRALPTETWYSDYIIDFFSAGPAYSTAYAAAMRHDPTAALLAVTSPTLVATRADDVLYSHLDRVPVDANPALTVRRLPVDRGQWLDWIVASLGDAARRIAAPAFVAIRTAPSDGPAYVDLPHGQLKVQRTGTGSAKTPLLVLEAPATLQAARWRDALGDQPCLIPELPGFGDSDPLPEPTSGPASGAVLEAVADALVGALDALEVPVVDVLALGYATPLGSLLAARHPGRVRGVALDGVFTIADEDAADFAQRLCPEHRFDLAGGHLHANWHMLRDSVAAWPWFSTDGDARRNIAAEIDALDLHRALIGILKQPAAYGAVARAACLRPEAERHPGFEQEALVFDCPGDPGYRGAPELAARLPSGRLAERPAGIAPAARILREFLDR